MKYFSLALRNLERQRRRTFLLGGAIAFGVFIMGSLNTLAVGLRQNVETNLLESQGGNLFFAGEEALASGRLVTVLEDPGAVLEGLTRAGFPPLRSELRSSAKAAVLADGKTIAVTLEGHEATSLEALAQRLRVVTGSTTLRPGTVALPLETAKALGVSPGSVVLVRTLTVTGQENVIDLEVGAVVVDPISFGGPVAIAPLADVNHLLGVPAGGGQSLSVLMPTEFSASSGVWVQRLLGHVPQNLRATTSQGFAGSLTFGASSEATVSHGGPQLTVSTLEDTMAPLLGIVETLGWVNVGISGLLLLVIAVGLANTFQMILLERTREIGTLRAIGMHRVQVLGMFLSEAAVLALTGTLAGTLIALVATQFAGGLEWPSLAGTVGGVFFRSGRLGLPYAWGESLRVAALILLICLGAAGKPSGAAARQEPALALRTQN